MKIKYFLSVCILFNFIVTTSCTKTRLEVKVVRDTVLTVSKDTIFQMDTNSFDLYSYYSESIVAPAPNTYLNTNEGVKFFGTSYRLGARLQTKTEISFKDKTIYYKWKGRTDGFAGVVPQIKYNPVTTDGNIAIQGADFDLFTFGNTVFESTLIQNDTWYYTTAKPLSGTNNYLITTCTSNYSNNNGVVVHTTLVPVYTTRGYLAIRIGDNYGANNDYLILGECKIGN